MLHVTINGQTHEFAPGGTILNALEFLSIKIPTACHDPRMTPIGGCRLCVVKLKGAPRPVTACNTPLQEGMEIETHTPEIEQTRRTNLELLAQHYPADAVEHFPEKEFHRYLLEHGVAPKASGSNPNLIDDSHPYIHVDMSRCIYCFRCVRICAELQGQFVWRVWNRGDQTRILPDSDTTLLESSCVACGACVDSCPSGALEDKTVVKQGVPERWTRTTCPYCGVGCEMNVGTRAGRIVQVKPVLDAPVSKGHLCVKGRYAFAFAENPDRVTEPMIRENGTWMKVSWDEAIAFIAAGLQRIIKEHGCDSVGVLGSARATNEENYLAQKFARVVIGTNNVDCCARVCHAPSAAAMRHVMGTGAATNSFDDIESAHTILLCGSNATENHPIVGARIKQAKLKGAHLIVIDPRKIELAQYADFHLQLRPGTNIPLLNAMAFTIIEERLYDKKTAQERITGFDELKQFISSWSPESVNPLCHVEPRIIRDAARLYATAKPAICFHGLGMTEHVQGTEGVMCLINLALLTGNFGKEGTGVNPLRGQNNVQGSAHMGCEPNNLTGFLAVKEGKDLFEQTWKAPIPTQRGRNLMEMMDAASAGQLRALWAIGYDVALTNPNAQATINGLKALDLLIVQDMFFNKIAEYATVFLPVTSSFEKDGTFMNSERRIQRVRKIIEPIGNSKTDWQVICDLARAMGFGSHFAFRSAEDIWNEIRSLWKAGHGITYARLEQLGIQWPCPSEDHPGTRVLHRQSFPHGTKASLQRVDFHSTKEKPSAEFPFLLTTGRTLYQFNAGTMTMRTANADLRPSDTLDISDEDAGKMGLQDGQVVRIRSRHGETRIPVKINPAVNPGEVFTTFTMPEILINRITSPNRDNWTMTPEYKLTAVQIEKL